ncbi:MAG: hypothetical protein KJS97_12840 [Alphaproteobacteria bacterium]|nr:hypothetical protein [Alphaproteobacteria bacterium]
MSEPKFVVLPDLTPMLLAVGKGINAWSKVEMAFGLVFASMMDPAPRAASLAVLDAAKNAATKLRIIDAAAPFALQNDDCLHLERWRKLSKRTRNLNKRRNMLAHWEVSLWPGAKTLAQIESMQVRLVPPMTSFEHMPVMWRGKTNLQPLTLMQINAFSGDCVELTQALLMLGNDLTTSRLGKS